MAGGIGNSNSNSIAGFGKSHAIPSWKVYASLNGGFDNRDSPN